MIWGMFGVLLLGVALGAACRAHWDDAMHVLGDDVHKKEMDEIFEEVKRLRAQVALHIGKEKE